MTPLLYKQMQVHSVINLEMFVRENMKVS